MPRTVGTHPLVLASLVCAFGAVGAAIVSFGADERTPLVLDHSTHDFGVVAPRIAALAEFRAKNGASRPIEVVEVVSSCGCTNVTVSNRRLPPGGETTVSARLKVGESVGPVERSLELRYLVQDEREVRAVPLTLKATVERIPPTPDVKGEQR